MQKKNVCRLDQLENHADRLRARVEVESLFPFLCEGDPV